MKSDQSIQSQMHQMLPQGSGSSKESKSERVNTDLLKMVVMNSNGDRVNKKV